MALSGRSSAQGAGIRNRDAAGGWPPGGGCATGNARAPCRAEGIALPDAMSEFVRRIEPWVRGAGLAA